MKKDKKVKKIKKVKVSESSWEQLIKSLTDQNSVQDSIDESVNLSEKLRKQADEKNTVDCQSVLDELEEAANNGEYVKTIQLRVNQVYFFEKLGLTVKPDKNYGFFEISWR